MTSSDPDLQHGETPEGESVVRPDPWGVRRAENLLTSLQGVLSARVEVSPLGEVTAVHVLTNSRTAPKQMVRNVESALLAQLGLKDDHRKISIAQTADVKPIEVLERDAVREEARRRLVTFRAVEVSSVGGQRVRVAVKLAVGGDELVGEAEAADTPKGRMQAAARATLELLDRVVEGATVELEGARLVEAFDAQLVMVGVQTLEQRGSQLVLGTAEVREGVERAAVLAVLDATNRWIQARA